MPAKKSQDKIYAVDIVSLRGEISKTFANGFAPDGQPEYRLEVGGPHYHYKDNYQDPSEAWKDIDLTIVNGRVDKAPYIMVIDGNKVTVTDKKTGKTSVVELTDIGSKKIKKEDLVVTDGKLKKTDIDTGVDFELVFNETKIKFQRTIKSAEAAKDATFKITGDIPVSYHAYDADGMSVEMEISTVNGNIFEKVKEKTGLKYPVKVDPTLTVQGSGEDTRIVEDDAASNFGSEDAFVIGGASSYRQNALVKMSLSELPAGAYRTSSTFSAYYFYYFTTNPSGQNCALYKIRRADWAEEQATWNRYKTGSDWGTAGANNTSTDIDTAKTATTTFPASYNAWMNWNVEDIVADAVANSLDFNIRISTPWTGNGLGVFRSKNYNTNTTLRPKLVIEYIVIPAAPTNVAASENNSTKVVVTWAKSTGATGYDIYRRVVEGEWAKIDTVGDVATYDDTGAAAPVITPGAAAATDGTIAAHVALSLSGHSIANGTTYEYKVIAKMAGGDSGDSNTDTGYRLAASLTYQWQRSAADSDADYSAIEGATTASYNDTGAPSNGDGRYYKCVLSATGSSNQTSTADRGNRMLVPTVTTGAASDLASTSVTANGNITATGGGNASQRGFCYLEGVAGDPDIDDGIVYEEGSYGTGAFSLPITGLAPETNYRVRAFAVNAAGISYGATVDALTIGTGAPTVTTQAGSAIDDNSFNANGNITSIGAENSTRRGFCYFAGTYGNPDIDDSVVDEEGDYGTGAFALEIGSLPPGTAYRVRAFAENSYGLSYGDTVTVTTSVLAPTVTTQAATGVLDTSVTGNGNITATGGDNCSRRGFAYLEGTAGDPVAEDGEAVPVEGLSKAAACVITWEDHGLVSNMRVTLAGITQAEWSALNATHVITWIDADTFSIPVDTSGYTDAYVPATDPGTIARSPDDFVYEDDDWGTGAFALSITGLTPETAYRIRAFATNDTGTGYGTTVDVETTVAIDPPTVTTQAATEVEQTSITGNGTITATGGANANRRGFCYMEGSSGDPDTDDSVAYDDGDFGTGAFSKSISGLSPGKAYRVRAYAVNSDGTGYGDTVQVNTPAGLPTVTTQACSAVTGISATGNGTITATGGANATRRGFVYMPGTTGDPTVGGEGCSVAYDDGDFGAVAYTKSITGLSPGTSYRVRAYAVNSAGTSYGTTVQLTTLVVVPTVTTQAATSVLHNSCLGNGNITSIGGGVVTRRGFCYMVGTSGDPTTANSVAYDDGSFGVGAYTKSITGLSPSTGYRVRAYVVNSAGTSYGATVQVNTLATPVIPTVTTQAASGVGYDSATGNGNITNIGNINCTRRGLCYKTGTSGDPVITDSIVYEDGDFGVGAFALLISSLEPGTGYRVRAYAVNSAGVGYGTTVQVTTLSIVPPTVTTGAVSDEGPTTITGNGTITAAGGENCTRRGFCYRTGVTGDPTVADAVEYEDGDFGAEAFALELSDLTPGTYYRVRAYAVNSAGVGYGTTVQALTTANPNFITEKNKRADGPTPINLLTFGFATPVYLSDRDITPTGGALHSGLVKTWGFIDSSIAQTPGSGVLGKIEIADLQLTIINSTNPRFSDNFTTVDPPEKVTVTLYQWFDPLLYSEKEILFKGVIYGQPKYDEYTCTLTIRGIFEKYNRKIGEDKIITAALYPDADPDDIGKMENIGYGTLKDVPCRALKAGRIDTLRDDLTAAATSFYVSGEAAADFPNGTVVVQIDDEKISGTYSQTTKQFTSCTRAYGGTTAVAHTKGAQVAEVLTEYIYGAFGHAAHALNAVRVDGVEQTTGFTKYTGQTGSVLAGYEGKAVIKFTALPTVKKQVNLDVNEGSHYHGDSATQIVTWTFDSFVAASGTGANSEYLIDKNLMTYMTINPNSYQRVGKTFFESYSGIPKRFRVCVTTGAVAGYALIGASTGGSGASIAGNLAANQTLRSGWVDVLVGVTDTWMGLKNLIGEVKLTGASPTMQFGELWVEVETEPSSPATGVALTGNSTAETVIGQLVTVDAEGYRDDASGTYTGTPNSLIERPDHVFRHIWAVLMGAPATDIDDYSFVTAGTFYAANTYKFAKLINDPVQASDLLMRLALQCLSRFIVTGPGKAKLFVRQLDQASGHPIVKDEIKRDSMSVERSPTDEIINLFNINYDLDLTLSAGDPKSYRSALKFTDATSVSRYGTKEWKGGDDLFCFDAVRLAAMAQHVGDFLLDYHQRARKLPHFGVFLDNMEIAPGDIIDITHPLDAMTAFVCEVQKVIHHIGNSKQIDWLEITAVENGA